MNLDITGLESRIFDGLSITSRRKYIYACNMETGMSRWSKYAVEDFQLPGEYFMDGAVVWGNKLHPEDREEYFQDLDEVFTGKKDTHNLVYRVLDREGNYVMCTCRGVVVRKEGEYDMFVGSITNHGIAELIDPTTSLYNVYSFLQSIRMRNGEKWLIMLLGLNRFSIVNDVYGYSFGDRVLKKVAEELMRIVRRKGLAYRMDGAKFALVFKNPDEVDVEDIYSQIQEFTKQKIIIEGNHIPVTVSCGVVKTDHADTGEYTIQASASYALEKSKHTMHGELVYFQDEFQEYSRTTLELLDVMRQNVVEGCKGFYMCYQPVVAANSGKIIGMEALLRWNSEPYGEVPPGRFIPWLENDTCFFELGNWILERAMTEGKPIVEANPDFIINVNVSATQIERRKFRESVMDILQRTGFPPTNLCLELTERCRAMDMEYLKTEVHYFRSHGIKVALDDFGTGHSSLELLCEFPFDCLKIDRGFVRDIEQNRAAQVVVDSIVQCANGLGMEVCVEGIENEQLRDFINQYGAHSHQGYLYSKPIRMEEFMKLLAYA